jgi:hypothetical protein
MHKVYLVIGTVLAGLSVVLGAFGAHGLKQIVPPETVATYQTGVQYQIYHAFALILVGILYERFPNNFVKLCRYVFHCRCCTVFRLPLPVGLAEGDEQGGSFGSGDHYAYRGTAVYYRLDPAAGWNCPEINIILAKIRYPSRSHPFYYYLCSYG